MPSSPSSSSSFLPDILNPCGNVRRTCREIVEDDGCCVEICRESMPALLKSLRQQTTDIAWDAEGWHYIGESIQDPKERIERVMLYVLALDAINFCFWPVDDDPSKVESNTLEYEHLAVALTKLATMERETGDEDNNTYFFSPTHLANLTPEQMSANLKNLLSPHTLCNMKSRCRLWNELGAALEQYCHDCNEASVTCILEHCQYSAPRLVQWLVSHVPGFRDESLYTTTSLPSTTCKAFFYKRSQIAVADLQAALTSMSNISFSDIEQLTTFADYRVPQLLRHLGTIRYHADLADRVDRKDEILAGSMEELSIRAATVVAVDELVELYNASDDAKEENKKKMTAVLLDWHLWQVGEKMHQEGQLKPHHRTRTIFY